MSLTYGLAAKRAEYARNAVLSATPARLLTMLYDRLLLDLSRAEAAQQSGNWPVASENLVHAQAIVSELTGTLKTDVWDGAENLKALYAYCLTTMMDANIHRSAERTRECIDLLEPLRLAWHEAAAQVPAQVSTPHTAGGTLGVG
ncbi:flagellar export chaperone FliS [Arthrobacter sp. ATA002]|uniref:flagellar export chaperone FliS n=1 Tax=Arthrobacter sp. ATA002 TaxID=2991715 RepID=UPI0022A74AB1|nr:flagellar export chaperone FliS [Arthrobacter sp. ATA002]WAP51675.1 flagellar export chaperone FliS [Arthrobacter sp. ATA002]